MILPDKRLHLLLGLLLLTAVFAVLWPVWLSLWWLLLLMTMSLAIGDALLLFAPVPITVDRRLDTTLPLGRWQTVRLELQQQGYRPIHLRVFDHVPDSMQFTRLPLTTQLHPGHRQSLTYRIKPLQRGDFRFPKVQLHLRSPLRLWWRNHNCISHTECKVCPDFNGISRYDLTAMENHLGLLGVKKRQRRGDGQDFHQLRDYRFGDTMRQIDWKATSRTRKLISREYQEEHNQEIVFLLDCSHRMATRDGSLSHFDHSLNAVVLLTHIAERQGDEVGITTFGGIERSIAPTHGQAGFNRIMQTIYNLQPQSAAPDYHRAATLLLHRQKKRALVILLTNLQDQGSAALQRSVRLISRKHLLVIASLREAALDQSLKGIPDGFEQALRRSALHRYLLARQKTFDNLAVKNIIKIDTTPDHLATALINRYFQIKRSGSL